jgi:hypothetical protein
LSREYIIITLHKGAKDDDEDDDDNNNNNNNNNNKICNWEVIEIINPHI